jgi:hypothetical protein
MNVQRDIPNTAVTDWTDKIELFMQYPFLVVGTTARFTVHLTDMRDFQPVTTGRVVINIEGGGSANRFVAERPSSPGIFGVDVLPTKAGTFPVSSELSDTFHIDHVTVYPDAEHLSRVVPPTDSVSAEGGITFLKEQQWTLEFGTALVEERQLRPSLLVPAEIIPAAKSPKDKCWLNCSHQPTYQAIWHRWSWRCARPAPNLRSLDAIGNEPSVSSLLAPSPPSAWTRHEQ